MENSNILRCGVCGAPLQGSAPEYVCEYCGCKTVVSNPQLQDDLRAATAFRECARFDEAATLYRQIVKTYKGQNLTEAY